MRPRARLGAAAALLALVGCAPDGAPGPNVFLIVVDATSASYLSPYGAPTPRTPAIAALAADSVVFENAYAQTPTTVSSTASLLTGLRLTTHQVTPTGKLPGGVAVLPERLARAGYRTHAIVANPLAGSPELGFERGYDQLVEVYKLDAASGNPVGAAAPYPAATPENVNETLLPLVESLAPRGHFVHVHYLHPHTPYDAAERFYERPLRDDEPATWSRLREMVVAAMYGFPVSDADRELLERAYIANVRRADAGVGELLDALRRRGLYDEALIVLASDHGEAFGGHGWFGHNRTLYDDMVRIPLLIKFPRSDAIEPGRVGALAETIDLAPTLLDYLGLEIPESFEGDSLLAVARRERDATDGPEVVLSTVDWTHHAVRVGRWKLIVEARSEPKLFDLESDPDEQQDLAARRPEVVARLGARLRETLGDSPPRFEGPRNALREDPEMERLLEELGYVESSPGAP